MLIDLSDGFERRPWGGYKIILNDNDKRVVKLIVVDPKRRTSLQMHQRRSEYWTILAGRALVELGDGKKITYDLYPGSQITIYRNSIHRVANPSDDQLVFLEVQLGFCKEDDIIRIEDDYGRK